MYTDKVRASEGEPGLFRGVVNIRPGTHHIRFLVDNVTKCSTNLPTTVDFGNNLVNYIEVSADDLPQPESDVKDDSVPVTTDVKDHAIPSTSKDTPATEEDKSKTKPAPKTKPARPAVTYTAQIPQYLLDLDKAEDSEAYQIAAGAIEKLPTPPSLPGFLGKPILNAATPMKDDNSVLTMPNHTVLNHLATSSIKNNVLAVSATTRYRRKVSFSIICGMWIANSLSSTSQLSCTSQLEPMRETNGSCTRSTHKRAKHHEWHEE